MREYYYVIHFVLNYRKCDRLTAREFVEKDNNEISNRAATASDGVATRV